jgi:hypothetical protein
MTDDTTPWEPPLAGTEPEHLFGAPDELYALWDGAVDRARARYDAALSDGGLDQLSHVSGPDGRHPTAGWRPVGPG